MVAHVHNGSKGRLPALTHEGAPELPYLSKQTVQSKDPKSPLWFQFALNEKLSPALTS
jgi:hypothetical protein